MSSQEMSVAGRLVSFAVITVYCNGVCTIFLNVFSGGFFFLFYSWFLCFCKVLFYFVFCFFMFFLFCFSCDLFFSLSFFLFVVIQSVFISLLCILFCIFFEYPSIFVFIFISLRYRSIICVNEEKQTLFSYFISHLNTIVINYFIIVIQFMKNFATCTSRVAVTSCVAKIHYIEL